MLTIEAVLSFKVCGQNYFWNSIYHKYLWIAEVLTWRVSKMLDRVWGVMSRLTEMSRLSNTSSHCEDGSNHWTHPNPTRTGWKQDGSVTVFQSQSVAPTFAFTEPCKKEDTPKLHSLFGSLSESRSSQRRPDPHSQVQLWMVWGAADGKSGEGVFGGKVFVRRGPGGVRTHRNHGLTEEIPHANQSLL